MPRAPAVPLSSLTLVLDRARGRKFSPQPTVLHDGLLIHRDVVWPPNWRVGWGTSADQVQSHTRLDLLDPGNRSITIRGPELVAIRAIRGLQKGVD
eukprot:6470000-Amphidinium_carterae.3